MLTTNPGGIAEVPRDTIEMGADWLGAGLDPERSTLFIQSLVPEHAELHLLFSMAIPVAWLERVPTYKEMVEQLGIESPSYGLLGYPLLQSADILMYKAQWVPVGADQVPHIELTREVARRFNHTWKPVFPEPQAKLTQIPKVPGTDGRKMSKSYGNAIYLSDTTEEITAKIKPMVTDPARKRRSDPGNPDICPVFDLHRIFTPDADREACATGCRTAAIGCLDCKGVLLKHMLPPLAEIRERRQRFVEKPAGDRRDPARRLQARPPRRPADHGRSPRRRQARTMTMVSAGTSVRRQTQCRPVSRGLSAGLGECGGHFWAPALDK